MPWPGVTDYTDAISTPKICFADLELGQGRPQFHPMNGRPLVYSGNFASVYPVVCDGRKYAVRCFTREVRDQQQRYNQISEYLNREKPPGFVEVEYKDRGIRVKGQWYPIVKMEWVEGKSLDKYIQEILADSNALERLAKNWRMTAKELQQRGIAHNDLQHDNVMIQGDGAVRLVDYDGIFLPQYRGQGSPEIGHQNFQHPLRSAEDYAEYVDNFPALVIYLSLLAVAADSALWSKFNNDDNLIFKKSDFADPDGSECFRLLRNSQEKTIRDLAVRLAEFCSRSLKDVPDLENILNPTVVSPIQSPSYSYRDLLLPTDAGSKQWVEFHIDREDFFSFCLGLGKQELKTPANISFTVGPEAFEIRVTLRNGRKRLIRRSEMDKFLDSFERDQSWSTQDYCSGTGLETYCLALLRRYIDSHLLPKIVGEFRSLQAELQQVRQQSEADRLHSEGRHQAELAAIHAQHEAERSHAESNHHAELDEARKQSREATILAKDLEKRLLEVRLRTARLVPIDRNKFIQFCGELDETFLQTSHGGQGATPIPFTAKGVEDKRSVWISDANGVEKRIGPPSLRRFIGRFKRTRSLDAGSYRTLFGQSQNAPYLIPILERYLKHESESP